MKLVIISGHSGSGKSTVLHALEDAGFYCVDNIPLSVLRKLPEILPQEYGSQSDIAVSVDVRNISHKLDNITQLLQALPIKQLESYQILFLQANKKTLLQRYSSTRRKHPLTNQTRSLAEAIDYEHQLLFAIQEHADFTIDTSDLSTHELKKRILKIFLTTYNEKNRLNLLIQSFGFRNGIPEDADFIFDVRCLPNPFWMQEVRQYSGTEQPIQDYLSKQPIVNEMLNDLIAFNKKWLTAFEASQRSYMTIAIGCTGGKHRSVYIAEKLALQLKSITHSIQIRHRDLEHQ